MSERKMHCIGRLFHSLGAAIENDLSPSVLKHLHVGIFSRIPLLYDLRLYLPPLLFTDIRLEIYDGASPCIALKVISSILKSIRYNDQLHVRISCMVSILSTEL